MGLQQNHLIIGLNIVPNNIQTVTIQRRTSSTHHTTDPVSHHLNIPYTSTNQITPHINSFIHELPPQITTHHSNPATLYNSNIPASVFLYKIPRRRSPLLFVRRVDLQPSIHATFDLDRCFLFNMTFVVVIILENSNLYYLFFVEYIFRVDRFTLLGFSRISKSDFDR